MATFFEANQARMSLKMKLSNFAWYNWSVVISEQDGYSILINVKKIDNSVRKLVAPVVKGVSTRLELE
jgi:hypothetical protein